MALRPQDVPHLADCPHHQREAIQARWFDAISRMACSQYHCMAPLSGGDSVCRSSHAPPDGVMFGKVAGRRSRGCAARK